MVEEVKQPTNQEILELVRETGKLFKFTENCRVALIGGLAGLFYTNIPGGSIDDIDIVGLSEDREEIISSIWKMGYASTITKYFIKKGCMKIPTHYSFEKGHLKIHFVEDSLKDACSNLEYDMRDAIMRRVKGIVKYENESYTAYALEATEVFLSKLFKPIDQKTPLWYINNERLQLTNLFNQVRKETLEQKFKTLDEKIKERIDATSNILLGKPLSKILREL